MNLQQLTELLEKWYGAAPGGLGIDRAITASIANPILREFYARLGGLADPQTPYKHPKSYLRPLAAQDRVLPLSDLRREAGATVFGVENQDVFVIAASDDPSQTNALVSGDVAGDVEILRLRELTDLGVPLEELLVTLTLQETIFSVQDRYRTGSPPLLKSRTAASSGGRYRGRYVWPDLLLEFWLAEDVWYTNGVGEWAAHRNIWKQPPL
jgi:hypothetical protein